MPNKKKRIEEDRYYIKKYFVAHGAIPPTKILVGQSWYEIGAISFIIHNFKINSIVELGIDQGGLGILLALQAFVNEDIKYLGIELYEDHVHNRFLDFINIAPSASFWEGDVFSDEGIKLVSDFIQKEGRSLIYCDNGNKPKEFETYAPYLKKGDLLMVHDYPNEFNETNSDFGILKQLYIECLAITKIVLFEKE